MTDAEQYEFDLNGVIVYRNVLAPELVRKVNAKLDAKFAGEFPWSFDFLGDDPIFFDLMAHPRTMHVLRTMLGDWFRLDHAYGLQMKTDTVTHAGDNLHGGPREDQGEHQYQWSQGRMYNGLVVVMYALEDVNPGDGGFICVPGSHKANVKHVPKVESHLVINPSLKAGDMLIFTEALVHGTKKWRAEGRRRRSLLYKYSPGYSCWRDSGEVTRFADRVSTDLQRALLRPPRVDDRTPLPFPPVN
jgi:ectoine hydroxylase-related dioxygenase (phytanoyl-CoA dioxygenase family)